ncbi:hypothetical protein K501DRAFT_287703 [Backusella circina FSU 941]|nr:hypothetical protein K501DRAFT_287703 [Backusella circina FSU 941]
MSKSGFQPKDARAVSLYQDLDDDLFQEHTGKKMRTGTQALVEFLKTTSPEEFQRSPERSVNNLFSRIRKTKRPPPSTPSLSVRSVPSSTNSLPATLSTITPSYQGSEVGPFAPKKNYIEIIPQQTVSSNHTSFDTASLQSFVRRNNKTTSDPILPTNKKRESSLYSASLCHSTSIRSQLSSRTKSRDTQQSIKATDEFIKSTQGFDTIESALLSRLERIRLVDEELPSDKVATGLAAEHIRALGFTQPEPAVKEKIKVRHMQVQTEDQLLEEKKTPVPEKTVHSTSRPISTSPTLSEEQKRTRRAEAALEEALDHFEVVSGLAYMKLRELWEEKVRWENAYLELRERRMDQKQYPCPQDYCKEEDEEDELGLSEFPCSEM